MGTIGIESMKLPHILYDDSITEGTHDAVFMLFLNDWHLHKRYSRQKGKLNSDKGFIQMNSFNNTTDCKGPAERVWLDKDWVVPTLWSWITESPLIGQAPSWVCMMHNCQSPSTRWQSLLCIDLWSVWPTCLVLCVNLKFKLMMGCVVLCEQWTKSSANSYQRWWMKQLHM